MSILNTVKLIMNLFTSPTTQSEKNSKPTILKVEPESSPYYTWEKNENIKLSPHFNSKEFSCKCGYSDCQTQKISKDLVDRLEKVRMELGRPIQITSAYRCSKHQAALRASGVNTVVAKKSTHEDGEAVDSRPSDLKMDGYIDICAKHFESIGLAKTFLHTDTRKGYRRWNY